MANFESVGEILKAMVDTRPLQDGVFQYVEGFKAKHENESDEDFREWINK